MHIPAVISAVRGTYQVYHDMQYAQGGHAPVNNQIQDAELRHQIRRLASHTSIVVCIECLAALTLSHSHIVSLCLTLTPSHSISITLSHYAMTHHVASMH